MQMYLSQRANAECPPTCECILVNVVRHLDGDLQPIVEVNCSKRNFTTLPDHLPEHAKILKVENNRIDDLSPLIKNPIYREVTDLYMDHNLVRSIDLLEGSYWLRNFRVLSLKGNKLIEVGRSKSLIRDHLFILTCSYPLTPWTMPYNKIRICLTPSCFT